MRELLNAALEGKPNALGVYTDWLEEAGNTLLAELCRLTGEALHWVATGEGGRFGLLVAAGWYVDHPSRKNTWWMAEYYNYRDGWGWTAKATDRPGQYQRLHSTPEPTLRAAQVAAETAALKLVREQQANRDEHDFRRQLELDMLRKVNRAIGERLR